MRRDMNLIRKIVMHVESMPSPTAASSISIDGYSSDEVVYHCRLLDEAGLVIASDWSARRSPDSIIHRLTWAGHEFVDSARNDTIWQKTTEKVGSTLGTVAVNVLTTLLQQAALQAF